MIKTTTDHISYLGDGVYIQFDGYGYVLRANHHEEDSCTDQIYIEPSVFENLNLFVKHIKKQILKIGDKNESCPDV